MTNILLSRSHFSKFKEHLSTIILPSHKVVVIAFSFFAKQIRNKDEYDAFYHLEGEYIQKINNEFSFYGINSKQITWISYFSNEKEEAFKKIKNADILYFPGGSPDEMMERINEWNLSEVIENHKKIYMGSSAGAMIQFQTYHISPDFDYKTFQIKNGLNLLNDFIIEVHYRRRIKQKKAMRKMRKTYLKPIYAIPDDGCLIFHNNIVKPIFPAKQIYSQKGIIK